MQGLLGRLLGPYQLIDRLDTPPGAPYISYRAVDRRLFDRPVTVAVFRSPPGDPEFFARFERLAEDLTHLRHPHILPVQDFGEQDGIAYLVCPASDGPPLEVFLGTPHDRDDALRLAAALGDALDYAHRRGLAHGGLSPASVLLLNRPAGAGTLHNAWPVLADFGFAGVGAADGGPPGRPPPGADRPDLAPYRPPETGDAFVLARADLYALAAVLLALLTGAPHLPAQEGDEASADGGAALSPALAATLRRALAERPEERYSTGAEFMLALQEAVADDRRAADVDPDLLLDEARAAVTAGRFRAAGRAYTAYLGLRPHDELAQRELAAIEGRIARARRPAPNAAPPQTPAPMGANGGGPAAEPTPLDAPDAPATPDPTAAPSAEPAPVPEREARRGWFRRRAAPPAPPQPPQTALPEPEPPVTPPAGARTAPAAPAQRPSGYRVPSRPLVAPARQRQRLVLPSVLGAVTLVLLAALVGAWLLRRDEQGGGIGFSPVSGGRQSSPPALTTAVIPAGATLTGQAGSAARSSPVAGGPGGLGAIPVAPTPVPFTPTPVPTLPPLDPVFVDQFGDPASGFPRNPGGQEQPAYWEGEYRIFVAAPDGFTIAELERPDLRDFGDLVLEADVRVVGPAAGGSYGLVFHRQVSEGSIAQYFVLIDPDAGTIRLIYWAGAERTELLPPTPHPVIARGDAPNRLVVTRKGAQITLQVNGAQVFQADAPGPQRGVIGLRADAGAGPIEVHFDNVVIRPVR